MKKLPVITLVLFFICMLAVSAYSDVRKEEQENHQSGQISQPELDTAAENSSQQPLKERRVTLEDGQELVIVEVPDSWKKKTKLQTDKDGKSFVSCH